VSSIVLGMLVCRNVDGNTYLVADFKISCSSEEWQAYVGPALIMVLLYPIGQSIEWKQMK
jgi:hypothetical protein